jgi:hypothetical protein
LELTPQCLSMLTDHTYTPEEICQFEALLISTLNWQLLPPSPLAFLSTYSDILSSDLASPRVLQLIDLAMLTPGPVRAQPAGGCRCGGGPKGMPAVTCDR